MCRIPILYAVNTASLTGGLIQRYGTGRGGVFGTVVLPGERENSAVSESSILSCLASTIVFLKIGLKKYLPLFTKAKSGRRRQC